MSSKRESAMRKSSAILVRLGEESWEVEGNALSATRRVEQSERLTVQPRTKAPITLQSMRERIETTRSVQDTRAKFSAIASEPARPTAEPAPSETTKLAFYQKAWAYIVDLIAPSGAKSAASTLRGGLLVGMIFGCLSLLLFHQMLRINPMTQSELVSAKRTVSVPVWNQPTRSKPLSLPGVQIALLESGPFSSVDARNRAISSLAKEGIDGIVSSTSANEVLWSAGLSASALAGELSELKAKGVPASAKVVQVKARTVPVPATTDNQSIDRTQNWISTTMAALLGVTAWLSDDGRVTDAQTSLQAAIHLYPGREAVDKTGMGPQLSAIESNLTAMQASFSTKHEKKLMQLVVASFDEFMALHGITGVSS